MEIDDKLVATENDHVSYKNIQPFPDNCFETKIKCCPVTPYKWGHTETALVAGKEEKAVSMSSLLVCVLGNGIIRIKDPMQTKVEVDHDSMGALHDGLSFLGNFPVVGTIASVADTGLYVGEGDACNAAKSGVGLLASAVPIPGARALGRAAGKRVFKRVASKEARRAEAPTKLDPIEGGKRHAQRRRAARERMSKYQDNGHKTIKELTGSPRNNAAQDVIGCEKDK
jgi:hypothetical protein